MQRLEERTIGERWFFIVRQFISNLSYTINSYFQLGGDVTNANRSIGVYLEFRSRRDQKLVKHNDSGRGRLVLKGECSVALPGQSNFLREPNRLFRNLLRRLKFSKLFLQFPFFLGCLIQTASHLFVFSSQIWRCNSTELFDLGILQFDGGSFLLDRRIFRFYNGSCQFQSPPNSNDDSKTCSYRYELSDPLQHFHLSPPRGERFAGVYC